MQDRILRGIFGAWRLAHFDPAAMRVFDCSRAGAIDSFLAALIALPPILLLRLLDLSAVQVTDPLRITLVQAIFYVIGWTAFPVLMIGGSRLIGREERYLHFLVAFNWSNLVQAVVLLAAALLTFLLPAELALLVTTAAFVGILVFEGFVLRTAFAVTTGTAAMLTASDLLLALLIGIAADWALAPGVAAIPGG